MEIQLQDLIEQIKKDGVAVAEDKAASILENAKAEAEKIVSDAKAKAEKLLSDAKAENQRMVKSSEDAIRQAGRNTLISFRESVNKELCSVIGEKVGQVYSSDEAPRLIADIVQKWSENGQSDDLSVLLGSQDLERLEQSLLSSLKEKMLGGVTLKASDDFDGGFRIAVDGGRAYYDYSAQAIIDMMSSYLSPRVAELLKEAEKV